MKKLVFSTCIALLTLGSACGESALTASDDLSASFAANPSESGNKLQCFSGSTDGGYNGTCTLIGNGATLNTIDGDSDPYNNYAGVYVASPNLGGKLVGDVNKLSFAYNGSGAAGGSPRFSVPIDENNDGTADGYLFIDTVGCNDGDANVGVLDAVNDPTCTMYYNNVGYINGAAYANANPTHRIANNSVPFVIVDNPGMFTITEVQIGRGSAKSK